MVPQEYAHFDIPVFWNYSCWIQQASIYGQSNVYNLLLALQKLARRKRDGSHIPKSFNLFEKRKYECEILASIKKI